MKKIILVYIFSLFFLSLFGQTSSTSTFDFSKCIEGKVVSVIGNDFEENWVTQYVPSGTVSGDTLKRFWNGTLIEQYIIPTSSISSVSLNISTVDHNGVGARHDNGIDTQDFGWYLKYNNDFSFQVNNWTEIQSGDKIQYLPVPTGLADGNYTLQLTMSGGTPTLSWQ